ncbi:MAG: hypothetical protein UT87_C0005G0015 [Candidatus Levybacteria bacterium GW2011_GWC1_40_19]|nr:MAG: hypothetical protein UT87_C0005G0015 [Candidatus Levybacteria bacterium GW2011_GWC1_40_19]KKR95456.1 MAG: hypothetical protein UU45_C0001G0051 [Candidatus Levybacteria bacterium GW2011_GWA2_41_15]KKS01942.1 MAG: hypothetical protein UU52_C0005G0051 [Candidatus Levybacteria bacterium GW2011_GWB1_41_21]
MTVPPNRDIVVEFVSPREYSPIEEVRVKGFPFRMRYSTVPLPHTDT